jgi:hypothetical protein
MTQRPDPDLYPSEEARQWGRTKVLIIVIAILGGVVIGLLLRRYLGMGMSLI